ncbi:DoxX family protein [Elizabethkingia meningoseptica]|uniref:DoxX family protein n=1 Tax=Elizabethkingia meningoseptica TaxID=238 RepID=UPI002DD67BDA|nr:DoxX family protein [Elizabethkingia meningoseptica]MEC4710679.1 DoxX family protein [Elizabethkingia meningoseptica]
MNKNIDLGIFISRIAIGFPMLVYGISKLIHGVGFIEDLVIAKGFPSFFAYGVFVGEIIAPVMIIAGFRIRLAGLAFAFNCFTAICLTQTGSIFRLNEFGGWAAELLVIYTLTGLSFLFTGAGKYAVSTKNKWD